MRRNKPVILKRSDHRLDLGPVGYNLFVSRDKQQEERSARRLRAWMRAVIGLVIAGGLVVAGLFVWSYLVPYFHEELQIGAASGLESEPASSEVSALPVYDEMGLPVYDNEVNLFVINPEEPAQEDFAPQLGAAAGVQVDSRIVAAVELMAAAAKEDGLALTFTEGYVSYQEQGERFEEKVDQLMEEGLTAVMARTEAQSLVPEAGESDFQTGMCLRLAVSGDAESFEKSKTYSWLRNNMGKYGFVFRYPADKEDYTGCTEDLTVIRYVGSGHATSMQQLSMCLEEYISYLSRQG